MVVVHLDHRSDQIADRVDVFDCSRIIGIARQVGERFVETGETAAGSFCDFRKLLRRTVADQGCELLGIGAEQRQRIHPGFDGGSLISPPEKRCGITGSVVGRDFFLRVESEFVQV